MLRYHSACTLSLQGHNSVANSDSSTVCSIDKGLNEMVFGFRIDMIQEDSFEHSTR